MEIKNVHCDENNMDNARCSLRCLRGALARGLEHKLAIVRISTKDMRCGFAIFDKDEQSVTFTGDGFREPDYSNIEESSSYKSALILLDIFGIKFTSWVERIDFSQLLLAIHSWDDFASSVQAEPRPHSPTLKDVFQTIADKIPDWKFEVPAQRLPNQPCVGAN